MVVVLEEILSFLSIYTQMLGALIKANTNKLI